MYNRYPVGSFFVAATVVLAIDFGTGQAVQFPILYAIPIGGAAWMQKKALAYSGSLLLPALRLIFHLPWHLTSSLTVDAINLPISASALAFYSFLISRTSWQTQELKKEVRKLEGILPICASCKRIRNPQGEYEQMEMYITAHSEARFSHGLCPDCAEKYL